MSSWSLKYAVIKPIADRSCFSDDQLIVVTNHIAMLEHSSEKQPISFLPQMIGFIGSGKMAMAIAKGFIVSGQIDPVQVLASAPSDNNLHLWRQLGACTTHKNVDVVKKCDVVFLAVKPHIFPTVIADLKGSIPKASVRDGETVDDDSNVSYLSTDSKLFVSVMGGIKTETLQRTLEEVVFKPRIVRTCPNTPAIVGCGVCAVSMGPGANVDDMEFIQRLMKTVGICEVLPESQLDAFTGLVGSGPAYIYAVLEGLADGGVRMGLPRQLATRFAAQMTLGATKMALESGKHTGQLKDEVTSPAGTTIRAVQVLERGGIRGLMIDAVQASAERATELGDSQVHKN